MFCPVDSDSHSKVILVLSSLLQDILMLSSGIPPVCINVHLTLRLPLTLVNVTLCSSGTKY